MSLLWVEVFKVWLLNSWYLKSYAQSTFISLVLALSDASWELNIYIGHLQFSIFNCVHVYSSKQMSEDNICFIILSIEINTSRVKQTLLETRTASSRMLLCHLYHLNCLCILLSRSVQNSKIIDSPINLYACIYMY